MGENMNSNQQAGNKQTTFTLDDIFKAMKGNIFRDLNVADIVRVMSVDDMNSKYMCTLLSNPDLRIETTKLQDLTIQKDDVMLCIFTSTDFRTNLSKFKNKQVLQTTTNETLHSKNYGVLVGLIYREQNEGEQE